MNEFQLYNEVHYFLIRTCPELFIPLTLQQSDNHYTVYLVKNDTFHPFLVTFNVNIYLISYKQSFPHPTSTSSSNTKT